MLERKAVKGKSTARHIDDFLSRARSSRESAAESSLSEGAVTLVACYALHPCSVAQCLARPRVPPLPITGSVLIATFLLVQVSDDQIVQLETIRATLNQKRKPAVEDS